MIDAARRTRTHRPRAIVTGGAGFIGGHLADHLVAIGVEVLVIDDLSTGNEANIPADAAFEQLDLLDADLVPMFRKWRGATVYHLAAQASVARSSRDPIRDLALNTTVTHRVAAAARAASARRLMFVSSGGAVYGETTRATTERTPPHPTSYYGVHKLAAEGHVRLAGLPYAIARPSNVYGPRQTAGLEGFGDAVVEEGYTTAVVAGMASFTAIAGWAGDVPAGLLAQLYGRRSAAPRSHHRLRSAGGDALRYWPSAKPAGRGT